MTEIWKDIPGYEGLYQASQLGNIKGIYRESYQKGRWGIAYVRFPELVLKQEIKKSGYHYIKLTKNGKAKNFLVHRLVLLAFVGQSKLQCNHLDGNKSNNNINNLEYCTSKENLTHCINVLGKKRGEGTKASKLTEKNVIAIRSDTRPIRQIANDLNVTYQCIHYIKNGTNWKHV
jgi:hypothetical protein